MRLVPAIQCPNKHKASQLYVKTVWAASPNRGEPADQVICCKDCEAGVPTPPTIRVTLFTTHEGNDQVQVKDFIDAIDAASWFIHDSYFGEPYTRKAIWERL